MGAFLVPLQNGCIQIKQISHHLTLHQLLVMQPKNGGVVLPTSLVHVRLTVHLSGMMVVTGIPYVLHLMNLHTSNLIDIPMKFN